MHDISLVLQPLSQRTNLRSLFLRPGMAREMASTLKRPPNMHQAVVLST